MKGGITRYPFNTTVDLVGKYVFVPGHFEPEEIEAQKSHVSKKKAEFLEIFRQIIASVKRLGGVVHVHTDEPSCIYFDVSFVHSTEMDILMDEFKKITETLPAD